LKSGGIEAKIVRQNGLDLAIVEMHGDIGWPSACRAKPLIDSLKSLGAYDVLYGVLDSPGGSVIDSWAIFQFLTGIQKPRYGSLILITERCAGDAILIPLAFDQILMRPTAYIQFTVLHFPNPKAGQRGNQLLARRVAERTGSKVEDVLGWMDKNKKLSAGECLECSLCDAIV
jgi:ATP-dependent protease ClpP protease subunit